jgi:hypothetical protein
MSNKKMPQTVASVRDSGTDFFNDAGLALEMQTGKSVSRAALKRLGTYTAIFGILHALLYFASYYFLQSIPLGNATDAQIIDFYMNGDQRRLVIAGMYMMPFAGIAFLYFMVFLRMLAGSTSVRISAILSNIQLLAGTIFIGLLFTAAAASTSTAAGLEFANAEMDPNFARQLPLFSTTLLLGFAMRMTAMFVFTSSSIGKATKLVPNWFAYLGYLVGVFLLLSASFTGWFALVFPVWVILLCAVIWWRLAQFAEN